MRTLRGALFGCGMISEYHLRAWQRNDEVEIVALGNRTLSRAEARRNEFAPSARVYGDLGDLLANEDLDFIDVLTPPALHRDHCLQALSAGLNVICQKPIATTLEDAYEMVDASDRSSQTLAIHENHRYRPWFQDILRRSSEDFFGTIRSARFEQFDPREPQEAYKLESRHGVLLEYGTHIVDMAHALWGSPSRVVGFAHQLNPRVLGESLVHVNLVYPESTACINLAWKPSGLSQGSVLIIGDSGEAHYEGTMTRGESARFRLVQGSRVIVDETRSAYNDYVESFHRFQQDVVTAWRTGRQVPQPASDNLKVLETTFAAYESIATGQPVLL